jgi:hypothetical protein
MQIDDDVARAYRADVRDSEARAKSLTERACEKRVVRHDQSRLMSRAQIAQVEAMRASERLRLLEEDTNEESE